MLTDSMREKVWAVAGPYYTEDDWAHGRGHIERVVGTALEIGTQEGADLDVIELAAILHDVFENKETHSNIEGFRHEIEGAKEARKILKQLGVADKTVDAVCHCIESHRKRTSTEPQTIEAKCLFDADKLDCIGAIGVIRCAFVSFDHGQEFYREERHRVIPAKQHTTGRNHHRLLKTLFKLRIRTQSQACGKKNAYRDWEEACP
jgi:uncharacterized protein